MFFTPLQQECQMWQKQLSENLFCIEFYKFCYPDEIVSYFSGVSIGRKSTASLSRLPQNILLGNYFLNTLGYTLYKYTWLCWEKCIWNFDILDVLKWNCPHVHSTSGLNWRHVTPTVYQIKAGLELAIKLYSLIASSKWVPANLTLVGEVTLWCDGLTSHPGECKY